MTPRQLRGERSRLYCVSIQHGAISFELKYTRGRSPLSDLTGSKYFKMKPNSSGCAASAMREN